MKTILSKFFGRPAAGYRWFPLAAACAFTASSALATDLAYTNSGYTEILPRVDAVTFINTGTISNIFTSQPAEFSNTKNITNSGVMSALPGWYFNDVSSGTGVRKLAANFFNDNYSGAPARGLIEAIDGYPPTQLVYPSDPSYLWVHATNIVNKGILRVGANGWLRLVGTNINLTRGGLEVAPIIPTGSPMGPGLFQPDVGILDLYWDSWVEPFFNTANLWDGLQANSGGALGFSLLNPVADTYSNVVNGLRGGAMLTVTNMDADGALYETNVFVPTNVVKQAAFVGIPLDPNISAQVSFGPSSIGTNPMMMAAVQVTHYSTNMVTGAIEPVSIYLYDILASETNRGLFVNAQGGTTARPANYIVSRVPQYFTGIAPTGYPDPMFLFNPDTYTNRVVEDVDMSEYAAEVRNTTGGATAIPAGTYTNVPGRVQIIGDSVDLTRARIRGEGFVQVKARHLVSTELTAIDCENLSFSLATTNSNLRVANLAKQNTARTKGYLLAWSALWDNVEEVLIDNYVVSTNDAGENVTNNVPVTNTVNIRLHCLMVDATQLLNQLPVTVYELNARSPNLEVNDNMSVAESLFIDSTNFTLNSVMILTNFYFQNTLGQTRLVGIPNWVHTNAPNLAIFTNNGSLVVSNQIHFGDDTVRPYLAFVNKGSVSGRSFTLNSDYFQNSGFLSAGVDISLKGIDGAVTGGQSVSGNNTFIAFNTLKLNGALMTVNGTLHLNVTNALFDSGAGSGNTFNVVNGFRQSVKPGMGDLLGTTINTKADYFAEINHIWAAENRGPVVAGYENNSALGRLVCSVGNGTPLLSFAGAGAGKALYVDQLDITLLGQNFQTYLDIDPNFVIYYASARVGMTVPGNLTAEEYLDNQYNGRLRWVKDFAGPYSSVDVVSNGVTVTINRALRDSQVIDSDNDGIPNFFDSFPLGGSGSAGGTNGTVGANLVNIGGPGTRAFAITWSAAPNSVYRVDYRSDLMAGDWQTLARYTNASPASRTATVYDTNAPALAPQRFYRVGLMP